MNEATRLTLAGATLPHSALQAAIMAGIVRARSRMTAIIEASRSSSSGRSQTFLWRLVDEVLAQVYGLLSILP